MGADNSLADKYQVVRNFNDFFKDTKKSLLITSMKNLKELKKQAEKFFGVYELNRKRNKDIVQDPIDLDSYFVGIDFALEAFKNCINFIKTSKNKDEIATVTGNFGNDFPSFVNQITQLSKMATQILSEIRSNPMKGPLIYLELNIFDIALNVKKIDKPPYYEIFLLPVYQLHDQMLEIESQKVSITAPHGTGKTNLIPLFLACRIIKNSSKVRFIILIEHNISNIVNIKNKYREICFRETDEYDDAESLIISSSYQRILQFYDDISLLYYPVVGILSPLDTLKLIHSVSNLNDFASKAIFIIDDVHLRTVETDIFVQDIKNPIFNIKKNKYLPHMIMMSTIQDNSYQKSFSHNQLIELESKKSHVEITTVNCKNIKRIIDKELFKSMKNFFDKWIPESLLCVGSVIVFVPSEKVGQQVYKKIFNYYKKNNAVNVCPLQTNIRKGEKPDEFYYRLFNDIQIAEEERPEDINTLFLVPILLSKNISSEEKSLVYSQLPLPLVDKLSRVFITTIDNESILQLKDLIAIFDTGIQEVEFYDPIQSAIHVRELLLPKPFIKEHINMLKNCNGGQYFKFIVPDDNKVRPETLIPSVKRSDLSRQLLNLRSFGIKLEKQNNLPNEPDHKLLNKCFSLLKKIGAIDDSKELTPIGLEASRFSFISPFFAVATAKFKENQIFAYLCSLIIENSRNLITNPKSKLLCKNFNRDSDVVTLLESICEVTEGSTFGSDDWGLSIGTLHMIYTQIKGAFPDCIGKNAVVESVKWARSQVGGTIEMVDKFVSLLDKENFLNKRKGEFVHILGAGPGCEPTLIYKANDIFKFEDESDESESENISKIKINRRPGWIGLQSPGNVYFLSLIVEEENHLNRGLILHRDRTSDTYKPGIVSIEVDNPSLNSYFFVSLFEAYWIGSSTINNFIGIYHTPYPKKESAFLIHITNNDDKTFMNYCPKNVGTENTMRTAIPLLTQLMPFVPRSIMARVDVPLCAVEVIGQGSGLKYSTRINFVDDPNDETAPFAYPVNKTTLEYAHQNINEMSKSVPKVRFAITGESFYYKSVNGIEQDNALTYPDVNPLIKCVFDDYHPSHLVLLVNKEFPNRPSITPLKWIPTSSDLVKTTLNDIEDSKMVIAATSKILNGFGYSERLADVFFVSLANGFPIVKKGKVPEKIHDKVGFKDGEIKNGIYPLVCYFLDEFTYEQTLKNEIPLKEISSNNSWKNYPANEEARDKLCNQINKAVSNHFHLKDDDVITMFIGHSMLAIEVLHLPENLIAHEVEVKSFNRDYHPCIADTEIKKILGEIKTVNLQVTDVVHEPVIKVCVYNMRGLNKTEDEFTETVKNLYDQFGFLRASKIEYSEPISEKQERMGILGFIDVELYGMSTGLVFATQITRQFPIESRLDLTMTRTMRTLKGMKTINPMLPHLSDDDSTVIKVTPAEVEVLKELIAMRNAGMTKNKWNLDTNYNVLIIPASAEAAAKDMIQKVRDKENDTTCLLACEPPQIFLPQAFYSYDKDGTVKAYSICKQCMIDSFLNIYGLQEIINPLTHEIIREKLARLNTQLKGIPFIDSIEVGDENWPLVPIGQSFWALMSDPETFGPYLKSWFTAVIDIIIKTARVYITYCPNHPDIPIRKPKGNKNAKCLHCNMFFHGECREWHDMAKRCTKVADYGYKKCPNCFSDTEKDGGCNSIECTFCGKFWCYKCVNSPIFNTSSECHNHLLAAHGGYYT